ncbi:hypothetical protein A5740_27395 [Mycobacterium sp. GA-1841]|uniref:hypothetical protein n=1 Tax=Mycobacterium sp. GA-1841 TaxID=1834154 RepID=UPI00096D6D33|nr:hypothetical protein [Mycobacterium sp. GA-1841]OMC38232.1 hypothetical protein A5740_27395 [Mycobacterium sp. GA-1841]
MAEGNNSTLAKIAGLGLAGAGISHFVKPQLFESITKPAFPKNTQKHIYTNGSIETAIGVGLLVPKTRKLAAIGSLGYLAYLAGNAVRNR